MTQDGPQTDHSVDSSAVDTTSKKERYFTGAPLFTDPSKPLPGEDPPHRRRAFQRLVAAVAIFGFGVLVGQIVAPEAPKKMSVRVAELEDALKKSQAHARDLERTIIDQTNGTPLPSSKLSPKDKLRHEREGKRYAQALRQVKAQAAADLIEWFVQRWNSLLAHPQPDDRLSRRAALLTMLVGGMAKNISPKDFGPWQGEFFTDAKWLGELHFDLDGDGLPAKRSSPNPKDGFANESICHIAMAINQTVTDAQIFVRPELGCGNRENRMSVFLSGNTLDDALCEFVRAAKNEGFVTREQRTGRMRFIYVGPKPMP